MFDSKQFLSKCRSFLEKMTPYAPAGRFMMPVLLTGLILLGCARAPVMQEIPALFPLENVQAAETPTDQSDGGNPDGSENGNPITVAQNTGSGASGLSAAGTGSKGSAAAGNQISYTKPANGYKDGTYSGSAQGFGGTVSVKVTISGGKIAAVNITSAPGEDAQFLDRAKGVISKILSAQTPNVDAVSGATYSSNGIINAVKNALSKAGNSSAASNSRSVEPSDNGNPAGLSGGDTESSVSNPQNAPNGSQDTETSSYPTDSSGSKKYADGTYTGSAAGFGGLVETQVIIKDGRLTGIAVIRAEKETPSFLEKAKTVISRMLSSQTAEVDTVAGATYTSGAIITGVKAALKQAEESRNQSQPSDTADNGDGQLTVPPADNDLPGDDDQQEKGSGNLNTPSEDPDEEKSPADQNTPDADTDQPARQYRDGTFTGAAEGWGEIIEVEVGMEQDRIRTITVLYAPDETPQFLERAYGVIDRILDRQSTDVDTVSGATFSSKGILDAVKQALEKSKAAAAVSGSGAPGDGS